MAARVDIVSRSPKLGVMGLLLAGAVIGATGCAKQKAEGYYDLPAESTVTDAQYQGSGAGYRNIIRAPSQVQIELKPDARRQQNQNQQAVAAGQTTEDGQPVPEGAEGGSGGSGGSAPAPAAAPAAAPSGITHSLVPQPQTYMGTLPCFSPAMQCTAQRVTLTLAPNGRWRGRTAYLDNDPKKGPPVSEQGCWDRRTSAARHPDGRPGQRPGGIPGCGQQRAARALDWRPDPQPELQPDPPTGSGPHRRAGKRRRTQVPLIARLSARGA